MLQAIRKRAIEEKANSELAKKGVRISFQQEFTPAVKSSLLSKSINESSDNESKAWQ